MLEQLPGDAPAGDVDLDVYARVEDELGDLLFQVVFHSILATEAGVFDLGDVARGVHAKLVRRHPHVFGDVEAGSAAAVVSNWEQIKKAERSSTSLVDSISPGLPSLLYAHKLYRKAASVGLEPDPERDGFVAMRDALARLAASDGAVAAEAALGDLLAGAVVAARSRGVDAESSLRGWAGRFRDRFVRMEQLAAADGVEPSAEDAAGSPALARSRHRARTAERGGAVMTSYEIMGRQVTIPVHVRRARSWFASFTVPAARAAAIVAPTGLEPAKLPGGRAMLSLAFVRYDDGDLDAYREIAVAFLVTDPADAGRKGAYIHRLPVDQEFTCAAGREIWGFPKFVTPIEIAEELRADRATLTVDGRMALTITQRRGFPAPMRSTAVDAFSFGDGILRRTRWELRGSKSRMRLGGCRVELGTGAIADELRTLGLPKRALMSGCIGEVAMTFQAAELMTGTSTEPTGA